MPVTASHLQESSCWKGRDFHVALRVSQNCEIMKQYQYPNYLKGKVEKDNHARNHNCGEPELWQPVRQASR